MYLSVTKMQKEVFFGQIFAHRFRFLVRPKIKSVVGFLAVKSGNGQMQE
jgi:hypothetical protein